MKRKIYLIGGGELRKGETKLIDQNIMSQASKGANFVFIGFAAKDNPEYIQAISSVYGNKYNIIVPTLAKGKDFTIESIKSADIIYLGGGDTEELMRIFIHWNLVEHLRIAIDQGKCIVGMSAGALILSKWYIHEDKNIFELREGLGLISLGLMVHINPISYDKAKSLWSNNNLSNIYSFVAIGEGVAGFINNLEMTKIGSGNIWTINIVSNL